MDDASKKNKYTILAFGAVILIVLAIYAFTRQPATPGDEVIEAPGSNATSTAVTTTSTPDVAVPPETKKTVITPTQKPKTSGSATAYQKAVEEYQYRFQFAACKGNPGSLTTKQGVKIMLDNRDAETRTFGFGGAKYTVKGYSFVIVTAPKAGTHFITCNGGGAAQLITQK